MIGSVFLLAPVMGVQLSQQIFGLAIGVVIAGVVQALFQWPLLHREGFGYRWVTPWRDPSVQQVVKQMIPGAIGVAAFQINVLLTYGMAFWVDAEVIASFNYAVRLMELPQGVFGLSLATYLLPTLAGLAAEKKYPEFRTTLREGLGYILFVNLLCSVILIVLATPIIRLLFERGSFDESSTSRAALALMWLAPGLVAFSMVNILARGFYALGDVRTPMRISVFCLTLNVILTLVLVWRYRQAGLGMANSLSAFCNLALLLYGLRRKLGRLDLEGLRGTLPAVLGATCVAAAAAWFASQAWERGIGHALWFTRLGSVFVPLLVAAVVYGAVSWWLGLAYPAQMLGIITRRFRRKK
jgi:putative peptidoglycan lipid II flippase